MSPTSRAPRPASPKRPRTRSIPLPEDRVSPPERPRILGAEEKRQLILAHASNREPADSVQRFSLWAGVAVCVLVIAVGWIYSMRQTIASAFDSSAVTQITDEFETNKDGNLQENLDALMQHLDEAQAKGAAEIKTIQVVAEQVQEAASSSAARQDLFKPAMTTNPSKTPSLPSGVKIENY